jgi:hypothetical protein
MRDDVRKNGREIGKNYNSSNQQAAIGYVE